MLQSKNELTQLTDEVALLVSRVAARSPLTPATLRLLITALISANNEMSLEQTKALKSLADRVHQLEQG